ncbi:hypothetical protein ACFYLX_02545 [Pseudarthrobacter enclensis]|uniref:hypothetical protein n=1 Tax=Pseudarthrobacter enclensis TaxID=993070 RepID=UPI0036C33749
MKAFIDQLNRAGGHIAEADEPLVEVEDLGEDPLRGRELEVALREDIAHKYSRIVDRMAENLAKENGITSVIREDREILLVGTLAGRVNAWRNGSFATWLEKIGA